VFVPGVYVLSINYLQIGAEILANMKQVSHRGPPVLERSVSLLSGTFCSAHVINIVVCKGATANIMLKMLGASVQSSWRPDVRDLCKPVRYKDTDGLVGLTTRHGLDGPAIKSRWGGGTRFQITVLLRKLGSIG
jgi:cystathionine beta-lyase family protein involved in aluminum resistance